MAFRTAALSRSPATLKRWLSPVTDAAISNGGTQMMYGIGFGGGLMMVAWVLFWVFVVAGIVWLVLVSTRSRTFRDPSSGALHILEERLARGEIDAEEFRTRRAAIDAASR